MREFFKCAGTDRKARASIGRVPGTYWILGDFLSERYAAGSQMKYQVDDKKLKNIRDKATNE